MIRYSVFVRSWWRYNPSWPSGLEPSAGRKKYLRKGIDLELAQSICANWNRMHKPGRLSRKCEFEEM